MNEVVEPTAGDESDIVTGAQVNEEDLTKMVIPLGINIPALRENLGGPKGYTLESFVDNFLLPAMRDSLLKHLREELAETGAGVKE